MLGTKALQIFDETTCVVRARAAAGPSSTRTSRAASARRAARARTGWSQIYERLETGEGTEDDLEKLLDISDNIFGRSFCALGDGAASPITSVDQVLPRRVRRAPDGRRLPVRPARLDAVRKAGDA